MRSRARSRTFLAGVAVLVGWMFSLVRADAVGTANGDPSIDARVVSYFVGRVSLPAEEYFPDRALPDSPCTWRIHDPRTGQDRVLLELPGTPTRVRWDPSYRHVEFKLGNRVLRAKWQWQARAQAVTTLPSDSAVCDFWQDPQDSSWWVRTFRLVREDRKGGHHWAWYEAALWQLPAPRLDLQIVQPWRVVRADTALSAFGGCESGPPLPAGRERPPDRSLLSLLESMRIGHYSYRVLEQLPPDSNEEQRVWIASEADTNRGVECLQGAGDTVHAMEPVTYVHRGRGIRREVYPVGTAEGDSAVFTGQLGLREADDDLLIGAEYSGASSRIVDMRTGDIRFILPNGSSGAVWVPPPSPAE